MQLLIVAIGLIGALWSRDPAFSFRRGLSLFSQAAHAQLQPPYPPSPVITNLEWAPADAIRRAAEGSDTFPLTWGDDDLLYTAFADGNGFIPQTDIKLSLGFAFITGAPENYAGSNIRSPQEQQGDGASGMKASGMLMVDGALYMWMRNADNAGQGCRLAQSTDHARNWTISPWYFAEYGYCTFINYGQNYAGAPDGFVYTVSPDSWSAYEPGDGFVLLRAPKTDLFNRDAYQFYAGNDGSGEPLWTIDIEEADYVFYHADNALRSGISYNAPLRRYIWWQQIPNWDDENPEDTRFAGGFGIYDAPQPWGPWTTVYFTENWDVGPGETGSFPTKWMSPDGLTMNLVFSGEDSFSVRRATLTVAPQSALPDVVSEEQNPPPAPLDSPLPPPQSDAPPPQLNSPLPAPVDNQSGSAASTQPEQSQSPLPTPTETLPPPTPTETLVPPPSPIATLMPTAPLSVTAPLTPTAPLTATVPLSDTPTVTATLAVADAMPTAAAVAPLPVAAPSSPFTALFSSEALILSLLCLIFFAVMMLGFGALMVNVFYIRSRRRRGY
ncbi:MAG: hypothetical protein R3A44_24140 [Caldilineaceae bacterium]